MLSKEVNSIKMPKAIDLTGKQFGRLTVICQIKDRVKGDLIKWLCQCDCGVQKAVIGSSLKSGNTKSCGCLAADTFAQTRASNLSKFGTLNLRRSARYINRLAAINQILQDNPNKSCREIGILLKMSRQRVH